METFSYNNYIKCIHKMRLNEIIRVAEEAQTYKIEKNEDEYTKKIKDILRQKKEIIYIINNYLNPIEKVKSEEIEICNDRYRNTRYKEDEIELIYQSNKKNMYYLIYYQKKVNEKLSYKILNYCIDFMQDYIRKKKENNKTYPLLVPIVIYTGKEKWQEQKTTEKFYNLIEIRKIPDKKLLESNNMFGNIMMIEKSNNKKDIKRRNANKT